VPRKLLPARCKYLGGLLLVPGSVLGYFSIVRGFEFPWLDCPVFAVYSRFAVSKFFVVSRTNLTNEIAVLLVLLGFLFLIFSREKNETEETARLRHKAMFWSGFTQLLYYAACTLFTFGIGYIVMLCLGMVSLFVFYLIIFNVLLFRKKHTRT
jgi:hypothetical protein